MISAAFDPSYTTGWAHCAGDGTRPASGVWDIPKAPTLRSLGATKSRIAKLTHDLLTSREVKIVAIEEPFQSFGAKNSMTQIVLWSLNGEIQRVCHDLNIECVVVPPARWRSLFLGGGNWKRDAAKDCAVQRCRDLDWPAIDHNAAEAVGLWAWLKSGNEVGWQNKVIPNIPSQNKTSQKWWADRRSVGAKIRA